MPACLNRSVGLPPIFPASASSLKTMQMEDHSQGLIAGDNGNRVTASVLRRTLSAAEMCSKMWKCPSGGAIKKTASVEHLHSMIHGEEGNGSGPGTEVVEEIWSSIQRKASTEESEQRKTTTDVWGSILSEKKDDVAPAPYVHPLVKRSASSLSEKSLEICTESLGSETGSDVFSFLDSDVKEEVIGNDVVVAAVAEADEGKQQQEQEVKEVGPAMEANYSAAGGSRSKRAVGEGNSRSLPPPLPSLGHLVDGSNVQMRCHRQDGRLVVEAVSVPSRNCFRAERQDGRLLLLTFSGKELAAEENHVVEDYQDEESCDEEEEDDDDEEWSKEGDNERGMEEGGIMTMMKYKFLCLTRRSACTPPAPWAHRLNMVVPAPEAKSPTPNYSKGAQLIPATGGSLQNPYVYSWRSKELPRGGAAVEEVKEVGYVTGGCNGKSQQAPPRSSSLLLWPDTTRCIASCNLLVN